MLANHFSEAVTLRVRRRLRILSAFALMTALVVSPTSANPADAAGGYNEQHKVARVLDGDTIEVYAPGQTSGSKQVVRLIGVNTNEPGMCHAAGATNRLKNLIEGKWVTLKADGAGSTTWDGRYLRFVEHNGVDMSLLMIEESRGFVFRNVKEPSRNDQYALASYEASVAGNRIWNPTACGNGPRQSAPLRMIINWDAPGADGSPGTFNGEWYRIFNDGSTDLGVAGWKIRETAARNIFTLPTGTKIPAKGFLTIYVGAGTNTATKVYLGLDRSLFNNTLGDAGYLLDPDDDIRVHFSYPCLVDCSDPLQGAMDMTANANAEGNDNENPNGEWINITNTSAESFSLHGYLLRSGGKAFTFPSNSTINPGERMRVHIGSGSNSRLLKHWGQPEGILSNSGPEKVEIVTYDDIEVASVSWPCDPCGPVANIAVHDYRWDGGPGPDDPRDEWLEIRNEGAVDVNLRDWLVMDNVNRYHFDQSKVLAPGAKIRINVGNGTDTANTLYWGNPQEILFSNDMIQVFSAHRDLVACTAWGDKTCGPVAAATSCEGLTATIVGTAASETIHGTSGNDVIIGGGGNDTIYGHGGNDIVCGNDGNDTLIGNGGNDILVGGGGDDTLAGNDGDDVIKGNGGTDKALFETADQRVTVDLRDGFASGEGADTISGIENLVGSDYNDRLYGDATSNVIHGGAGNDIIEGRSGKDTLHGEDGDDTVAGGGKADKVYGGGGTDLILGGGGHDLLRGGPDADTIKGKGGADTLYGQSGPDKLYGGSGTDTINGGYGTDLCKSGATTSCEL